MKNKIPFGKSWQHKRTTRINKLDKSEKRKLEEVEQINTSLKIYCYYRQVSFIYDTPTAKWIENTRRSTKTFWKLSVMLEMTYVQEMEVGYLPAVGGLSWWKTHFPQPELCLIILCCLVAGSGLPEMEHTVTSQLPLWFLGHFISLDFETWKLNSGITGSSQSCILTTLGHFFRSLSRLLLRRGCMPVWMPLEVCSKKLDKKDILQRHLKNMTF